MGFLSKLGGNICILVLGAFGILFALFKKQGGELQDAKADLENAEATKQGALLQQQQANQQQQVSEIDQKLNELKQSPKPDNATLEQDAEYWKNKK